MKNPLVSVIIAAYNEEKNISLCLESLEAQTYSPLEIIVVDDGSTDKTWKMLQKYHVKNPKIKIYTKEHIEQATARNFGFTFSRGTILVFPDADYTFDRKFIEKLVLPIVRAEAIATFTKEEFIKNPDTLWSKCWSVQSNVPFGKRIPQSRPDWENNFRAIRRREFVRARGFSETGYTNDVTVLNKLGLSEASYAAPGAVCYHVNPDSLKKVFRSAFRMGSQGAFPVTPKYFIIFSIFNSLVRGVQKALVHSLPAFILFAIVYDMGALVGLTKRYMQSGVKNEI